MHVLAISASLRLIHYDRESHLTVYASLQRRFGFSISAVVLAIVEQSRKREIKFRMNMCFMPLRFKVQVRNKSFRVPLMA